MRGFLRVTTQPQKSDDWLARTCPRSALYWRSLVASLAQITYWSGMWELLDTDLRGACWTSYDMADIGWDVLLIVTGFVLLLATESFLGASGLSEMPPLVVMSKGWRSMAYLIAANMASLYAQVALGLGIYNMFDVHMFGESAWWNMTCCGIGLVLLLATRTLYANAGLAPDVDRRSISWVVRGKLYVRATGGVAGAFILWKGWENMMDYDLGLPEELWREVLYTGCGLLILFMTRTFLGTAGIIAAASTAGDANELTEAHAKVARSGAPPTDSQALLSGDHSDVSPPLPAVAVTAAAAAAATITMSPAIAHVDVQPYQTDAATAAAAGAAAAAVSTHAAAVVGKHSPLAESLLVPDATTTAPKGATPATGADAVSAALLAAAGTPSPAPSSPSSSASLPILPANPSGAIVGNAHHLSRPGGRGGASGGHVSLEADPHAEPWQTKARRIGRAIAAYYGVITFWTGIYNVQVDYIPGDWARNVLYIVFGIIALGLTDTLYANTLIYPHYPAAGRGHKKAIIASDSDRGDPDDISLASRAVPPPRTAAAVDTRVAGLAMGADVAAATARTPNGAHVRSNLFFGPVVAVVAQPPATVAVDDDFFTPQRTYSPDPDLAAAAGAAAAAATDASSAASRPFS